MIFMEKNIATEKDSTTELVERKDHALEHLGSDGRTRTYLPAKSVWLRLKQLHVTQQLAEPAEPGTQPAFSTSLHGVADLDGQTLSIIGDSRDVTHAVEVSFWARDVGKADRLGLRQLEDELGISFADVALGTARLGVNRADPQTGEPDHWWLACYIPEACIRALSSAVSDGQLGAVEVALALRHLYTTETTETTESPPTSSPLEPDLFLRPNMSDGTTDWPEIAIGYVTHLRIDLATTQLRDAGAGAGRDDQATWVPVAEAVNALGTRLASLMTTARWICIFIAILVILEILERFSI